MSIRILFYLLISCLPSVLWAQTGGFGGAYTRMGFGPRGMAMGNALGSVLEEGVFAAYNPALAAHSYFRQFDASTALMSFDRSLSQLNYSTPLPPSAGLSIMLNHAGVSNIDGRSNSGYRTQTLSTNEFMVHSVFGIRLSPRLYAGVAFRLLYSDIHPEVRGTLGAGFDVGVLWRYNAHWYFSASIQDLLTNVRYDTSELYGETNASGTPVNYPTRFRLGASWRNKDKRVVISTDYELLLASADIAARSIIDNFGLPQQSEQRERTLSGVHQVRVGSRWIIHERFTLRAGLQLVNLDYPEDAVSPTAGFSLHLPFDTFSPSIDYAYVLEPGMIFSMHVFALRLHF